jgi:hypothetical protein
LAGDLTMQKPCKNHAGENNTATTKSERNTMKEIVQENEDESYKKRRLRSGHTISLA